MKLSLRIRQTVLSVQDAYVHHQAGLLDKLAFEQSMVALRATLSVPAYRAIWKITRQGYSPQWIAIVEQAIAETPVAKPVQLVEPFNRALTEVVT
jgi:hypothetical protein